MGLATARWLALLDRQSGHARVRPSKRARHLRAVQQVWTEGQRAVQDGLFCYEYDETPHHYCGTERGRLAAGPSTPVY